MLIDRHVSVLSCRMTFCWPINIGLDRRVQGDRQYSLSSSSWRFDRDLGDVSKDTPQPIESRQVMALSKLEEWLQNKGSSFIKFRMPAALRTVHRRHIAFQVLWSDGCRDSITMGAVRQARSRAASLLQNEKTGLTKEDDSDHQKQALFS